MIFFASCSAKMQDIIEKEAKEAGIENITLSSGGMEFEADLECAYRFALTTRCATRLLVLVYRTDNLESTDDLYERSLQLPWENWINTETTFAITETVTDCRWIRNSHFAALRLKDAIVERLRETTGGQRPSVDRDEPDIVFHLHVHRNLVSWYVDFAGRDLAKRGYRLSQTNAVMSEQTAAALLYRTPWYKEIANGKNADLLDPFCGSGTIIIEAILMATHTAPGLLNPDRFAFFDLPIHNQEIYEKVYDSLKNAVTDLKCKIAGWDIDAKAIDITRKNIERAFSNEYDANIFLHVQNFLNTTQDDVDALEFTNAFIVTDPPYGIRLKESNISELYEGMGKILYNLMGGWNASIITADVKYLGAIEMKPNRTNVIFNGGMECQVAHYYIFNKEEREEMTKRAAEKREARLSAPLSEGAQMAANRLKKNIGSVGKSMTKQGVTCYRLYDADMPEYSAAIDIYENKFISLQEYAAPSTINEEDAARRLEELINATERTTGIPLENIFVKKREKQKGANQYTKRKEPTDSHFFIVHENGHKFMVNFTDYIDTGLFLDHRPVRKMIEEMSNNTRFLNLFCYTSSATVYAAAGGALSTVSVDANANYLDWSQKNMALNGFSTMNHFFYKDDSISFLKNSTDEFDLIFCDPPTFSNNKSRGTFDVQRDHEYLVLLCMEHISPNGKLIFSTNFTKFKLSESLSTRFKVEDITEKTIGDDFARRKNIHKCYIITHINRPAKRTLKLKRR